MLLMRMELGIQTAAPGRSPGPHGQRMCCTLPLPVRRVGREAGGPAATLAHSATQKVVHLSDSTGELTENQTDAVKSFVGIFRWCFAEDTQVVPRDVCGMRQERVYSRISVTPGKARTEPQRQRLARTIRPHQSLKGNSNHPMEYPKRSPNSMAPSHLRDQSAGW